MDLEVINTSHEKMNDEMALGAKMDLEVMEDDRSLERIDYLGGGRNGLSGVLMDLEVINRSLERMDYVVVEWILRQWQKSLRFDLRGEIRKAGLPKTVTKPSSRTLP
ncbi:hypothetical protein CDAR_316961 [Caerostris darwini]|uniref:Uncharacterized protein n=1 Tax=Caerostris darwini TaxID=1538125 RepID=A0AAV4Q7D2_9ARAC|nr:hypothetical protein CDAR_316961 [Caerostris darwini]